MSTAKPEKCSWYSFIDEPLINGLWYAPKFKSPQIIMPNESCDGKWHMFFHSWIGLHHFTSVSGIAWQPRKMIEFRGQCPSIFRSGEKYCLLYEKHNRNVPIIEQRRSDGKNEGFSRIEMRTSTDLVSWSKPRLLLDSRNVMSASDYVRVPRLSNPQILKVDDTYRLYFGSSRVFLDDSFQKVPRYFGFASSSDLFGPYNIQDKNDIILSSKGDDRWTNLACGSLRLVQSDLTIYGFQCGAYWDEIEKKSKTALHILRSDNGIDFERCSEKPIMIPSEEGWASGYITGCDVHFKEDEKCWYCYFSANSGSRKILARESIGLLLGNALTKKQDFISGSLETLE